MFVNGYPTLLNFGGQKKNLGSAKFSWVKKYPCRGHVSRGSWPGRVISLTPLTGNAARRPPFAIGDQNTIPAAALDVKRSNYSTLLRQNILGCGLKHHNGTFYRSERHILAGRSERLPAKED